VRTEFTPNGDTIRVPVQGPAPVIPLRPRPTWGDVIRKSLLAQVEEAMKVHLSVRSFAADMADLVEGLAGSSDRRGDLVQVAALALLWAEREPNPPAPEVAARKRVAELELRLTEL
jgi:hypothetical protein